MTIEQIGILLSLLLTILGWSITAFYQRQILERQIAAEKERETRQLLIPRRIQQLEKIKSWAEEGYRLWHLWNDRPRQGYMLVGRLRQQREEIDRRINIWATVDYTTVEAMAKIIERFDIKEWGDDIEEARSLVSMLSKLVESMPTGNPHYYDEHPAVESSIEPVFVTYLPQIMRRIDELIAQTTET